MHSSKHRAHKRLQMLCQHCGPGDRCTVIDSNPSTQSPAIFLAETVGVSETVAIAEVVAEDTEPLYAGIFLVLG